MFACLEPRLKCAMGPCRSMVHVPAYPEQSSCNYPGNQIFPAFKKQLKLYLISRFCADIEHSCEVACPQLCYTKSLYLHYIMYDMHKECIGTWELKGAYEIPTDWRCIRWVKRCVMVYI